VILTLALGIGANAAMFTVLRGVLLRPLVNRDESRLIYIRQVAGGDNELFSMPEIRDLSSRMTKLNSFGDFSVIGFTMVGLGEPRTVRAGVVGGSYFQTMGLEPVLGRLLDSHDDGPNAAGAVVLTYRFWSTALHRDPSVLGKTVKLGSFIDSRSATIVGVLEPCVPYPQETEIIANVVTSSHHLSATMVTSRIHRMTELFARLPANTDLKTARAELESVYGSMKREHPEAYPKDGDFHVTAVPLREELTSGARTVLLVLMAASLLVFIIACSNVANLILARSVRREGELAIRAALGAGSMDLRRILLAESLLLCLGGAALGLAIARPMVAMLARYASRYSVRALDLSLDSSIIWVGAGLALLAAVLLAFAPKLPTFNGAQALASASSTRTTTTANRKLKAFALVQIAASFVLVTAAVATVKTLLSLETVRSRFDTRYTLAINVPVMHDGKTPDQIVDFYREAIRQIRQLPGVSNAAMGLLVPWRDANDFALEFSVDGHVPAAGEKRTRATYQIVSPGYFATLGVPIIEGRDFSDSDRKETEPVAIINETLARQMFPNGHALNHYIMWTDQMLQFAPGAKLKLARRIVGVVPDIQNSIATTRPKMTFYQPFAQDQTFPAGRLLVQANSNPYALVQPIRDLLHRLSPDQPVERASTLEDIRAELLSPQKLNVMVSGAFAAVALLVALVGIAGVLTFSVSGRTREFGIRLAMGSHPRDLLVRVMTEGAAMAVGGLAAGLVCGLALARIAGSVLGDLKMPGIFPLIGSALILLLSAVAAAAVPAARAASVDVIQALRSE
jgi:predicted permease